MVQVVVGMDTLLGSERPAELVGHGPIDADTARALAADAVIQRLITDPAHRRPCSNTAAPRYAPPAALADHVRSRDQICRGPRCTRRVRDLDHHRDWALHGDTDAGQPLRLLQALPPAQGRTRLARGHRPRRPERRR